MDLRCSSAIGLLKERDPGAFVIRDSHSFRGAYGLAMKVASPPPTVNQNKKGKCSWRKTNKQLHDDTSINSWSSHNIKYEKMTWYENNSRLSKSLWEPKVCQLCQCVHQTPSCHRSPTAGDLTNELVRHFLIESSPKGVKLKGCPNEPYFGKCHPASSMTSWPWLVSSPVSQSYGSTCCSATASICLWRDEKKSGH